MAISINEYNNNVNKFLAALPREVQKINKALALSTIPLIKINLVDKGVTGEGKSLGQYSDKPISPGFFIGKNLTQKATKSVQSYLKNQKKSGLPALISYKKFRELNNRPTAHVTISFTGETLNDLAIVSNTVIGNDVVTTVGSKSSKIKIVRDKHGKETGTVRTGDVLDQLGEKYGDILSLTPSQEKDIAETYDDEIQELINKYL